ncbi:MAG: ATP-binding protein [Pseudomonadales bacterium]
MRWSLKHHLTVLVLLALVPLVALLVLVFFQIRDHSERELTRHLTSVTDDMAEQLQRAVGAAGELALLLGSVWTDELDCATTLGRIHAAHPRYNVIAVGDASGRLLCSSPATDGIEVGDRPWFQAVMQRRQLSAGGLQRSRASGEYNIVVAAPFSTADEDVGYVVGAGLRLDWLSTFITSAGLSSSAIVGVLDDRLRILARIPNHSAWVGREIEGDDARAMVRQGGGQLSWLSDDGVQRRFYGRWIEAAGQRFFVYSGMPERALTALALRVTALQGVSIGIGGLALLLLTGLLARRHLLEPLSRAQRFAGRVADGDFSHRLEPHAPNQEVADLLGSLNTMADTLARNAQDIAVACKLARLGYWRIRRNDRAMVWSDELFDLLGLDAAEVTPSADALLVAAHADDRGDLAAALTSAVEGAAPFQVVFRVAGADGGHRYLSAHGSAAPQTDSDGVWMTAVCQDVTEQRTLEERVRQTQRLEAVGQLTGGVAHDFNNLLTVIIGNADLLVDQLGSEPRLREQAELVRDAALRGGDLTQRLLAFSRRQQLEASAVDVNALIGDMVPLLNRTLGEPVHVVTELAADLWPAWVDAGQLENAVMNLCLNARDAMPRGGTLTLRTEPFSAASQAHPELAPGDYVRLTVADTGTGMEDEVARQAFEPFFTTKDVGKGSGLGLSMVYGFAKQSRGHVEIDSAPDQGTTVTLFLPRAAAQSAPVAHPDAPADTAAEDATVLVVEDDELVRAFALRQLQRLGYRVIGAADAAEALALLKRTGPIDLLFTDVVMPGGQSGLDLANAVRAAYPDLPVLLTSGYSDDALGGGELPTGMHLLPKPYRQQTLAAMVRRVLQEAAAR